jgi:single-strand DNA-binding protein
MQYQNQMSLRGRLGADPELIQKSDAKIPMAVFSVAENVTRFDADKKQWETVHTNWFSVRAFGELAKSAAESLKKGDLVTLRGSMRVDSYKDKNGEQRTGFQLIASEIATPVRKADSQEANFAEFNA